MSGSHRNSGAGQHSRAILGQTDDSGPQQLVAVTGLNGQQIGEAVRAQHFGFSSHAPQDAEGLVLMLGGGADRAHVLGLEHPGKRPRGLPAGASRQYDADGNHVHIDNGVLRVQHASQIILEVGGVTFKITPSGIDITGGYIKHDGHLIDKNHMHVDSGGSGLSGPPE